MADGKEKKRWRLPNPAMQPPKPPEPPGVDRSQQILTNGEPVPADSSHTQIREDGQQKHYVVLTPEERLKGFVRPVRRTYRHVVCGKLTTMSPAIAETYARDPGFYSGTFCAYCGSHFTLSEFTWEGTDQKVGS